MNFLPHLKMDINLSVKEILYRLAQTAPTSIEAMRIDGMTIEEFRIDRIISLAKNSQERYKYTDQNDVDLICTGKFEFTNLRTNKKYVVGFAQPSLKPWQNENLTNRPIPLSVFTVNQRLNTPALNIDTTFSPSWTLGTSEELSASLAAYFGLQKDTRFELTVVNDTYPPLLYTPIPYGAITFMLNATEDDITVDHLEYDRTNDNSLTTVEYLISEETMGSEITQPYDTADVYSMIVNKGGALSGTAGEYRFILDDFKTRFVYDALGIADMFSITPVSASKEEELLEQMREYNIGAQRKVVTISDWINPLVLYRDGFEFDLCTIGDLHAQLKNDYKPPVVQTPPYMAAFASQVDDDTGENKYGLYLVSEEEQSDPVETFKADPYVLLTSQSHYHGSPLVLRKLDAGAETAVLSSIKGDESYNDILTDLPLPSTKYSTDEFDAGYYAPRYIRQQQTDFKFATANAGRRQYITYVSEDVRTNKLSLVVIRSTEAGTASVVLPLDAINVNFEMHGDNLLVSGLQKNEAWADGPVTYARIVKYNLADVMDGNFNAEEVVSALTDYDNVNSGSGFDFGGKDRIGIYNGYSSAELLPIAVPSTYSDTFKYSYIKRGYFSYYDADADTRVQLYPILVTNFNGVETETVLNPSNIGDSYIPTKLTDLGDSMVVLYGQHAYSNFHQNTLGYAQVNTNIDYDTMTFSATIGNSRNFDRTLGDGSTNISTDHVKVCKGQTDTSVFVFGQNRELGGEEFVLHQYRVNQGDFLVKELKGPYRNDPSTNGLEVWYSKEDRSGDILISTRAYPDTVPSLYLSTDHTNAFTSKPVTVCNLEGPLHRYQPIIN